MASSSFIFLINFGSNSFFTNLIDNSFIPKAFCLLKPQDLSCDIDNFDTFKGLTLLGAALIIASSVIIFMRESQLKKQVVSPRPWVNIQVIG